MIRVDMADGKERFPGYLTSAERGEVGALPRPP